MTARWEDDGDRSLGDIRRPLVSVLDSPFGPSHVDLGTACDCQQISPNLCFAMLLSRPVAHLLWPGSPHHTCYPCKVPLHHLSAPTPFPHPPVLVTTPVKRRLKNAQRHRQLSLSR
jgi:hypothetical protein